MGFERYDEVEASFRVAVKTARVEWECGDGCCSDGGYEAEVMVFDDDGHVLGGGEIDWESCHDDDNLKERVTEIIMREVEDLI